MKKMTKMLTAAVAGIMGAGLAGKSLRAADQAMPDNGKAMKAMKNSCAAGKNGCKGQGACKVTQGKHKHSCAGKNKCKGQGGGKAAEAAKAEANSCKGMNECKGKGGCKTDKHECSGKNECKGQGGCKASMKPASKGDSNACQGKNGCSSK